MSLVNKESILKALDAIRPEEYEPGIPYTTKEYNIWKKCKDIVRSAEEHKAQKSVHVVRIKKH